MQINVSGVALRSLWPHGVGTYKIKMFKITSTKLKPLAKDIQKRIIKIVVSDKLIAKRISGVSVF
jgi:hypothetical protein